LKHNTLVTGDIILRILEGKEARRIERIKREEGFSFLTIARFPRNGHSNHPVPSLKINLTIATDSKSILDVIKGINEGAALLPFIKKICEDQKTPT
jgi:hypothetical protein